MSIYLGSLVGMHEISCDVLVIGSGAAGLIAAAEARRRKAEVVLVSKAQLGYATSTMYSNGAFRAAVDGYTVEKHFEDTMEVGRSINDTSLVWRMVKEAPKRVLRLADFGLNLKISKGYVYVGEPPYPGRSIVNPLLNTCKVLGVRLLPNTMVTQIVKEDGEAIGAIALDVRRMETLAISAKAIILATGGCGQIYSRTDNPSRVTGDGYILALEAGAKLVDMEFVQFFPLGLAERTTWILTVTKGRLENDLGEDLLKKYGLDAKLGRAIIRMRDELSKAIMLELDKGREVFLDCSEAYENPDRASRIGLHILRGSKKVRICPLAHFMMGGVKISTNAETTIKGLYACGEVAGGVHGANRLGGNALTEAAVFGSIAGEEASKRAAEKKLHGVDPKRAYRLKELLGMLKEGKKEPREVKKRVKEITWNLVGIIRNEKGLREAMRLLEEIEPPKGKAGIMEALEAMNMVKVAKIVTLSALARAESRGAHFREDFPQEDSKWARNITIYSDNGRLKVVS